MSYLDQYVDKVFTNYSNVREFITFAMGKYRFEKYKLSETIINEEDYILNANSREKCMDILSSSKVCEKDDLKAILQNLSEDDLAYIGI